MQPTDGPKPVKMQMGIEEVEGMGEQEKKLSAGIDFEQLAREANLAQMNTAIQDAIAVIPLMAKVNGAYYDALLEEGFTAGEAIELVKVHGMNFHAPGKRDGNG